MSTTYHCSRQRAGPLVINAAALRPRFLPEGQAPRTPQRYLRTACNRLAADRVEARLALIGWGATEYVLTFADEWLPKKYRGVQNSFALFRKQVGRWRAKCGKPPDWDWLAVIEGKHGDHRWHLHFICDYAEMTQPELQHVWKYGGVEDERPVLLDRDGFWRLARYITKETRDGWIIPIGAQEFTTSRALRGKVPPPETWTADSRRFTPPRDAICFRKGRGSDDEPFDAGWSYVWRSEWLVPDWSPACRRAMIKMGYVDEVFEHEAQLGSRAHAHARARPLNPCNLV